MMYSKWSFFVSIFAQYLISSERVGFWSLLKLHAHIYNYQKLRGLIKRSLGRHVSCVIRTIQKTNPAMKTNKKCLIKLA